MTKEQLLSLVPAMVSIEGEAAESMAKNVELEFGVGTPGTMATTTSSSIDLTSPLGIFSAFAASSRALFDDDHNNNNKKEKEEEEDALFVSKSHKRLGISRPAYAEDEEDDASVNSDRIGIQKTDYVLPEGDIPVLSPMDMLLKKKKKNKATHDSDDDGEDLWRLNLQQLESALPASMLTSNDDNALPNDDVSRMLHRQTSEGHYLMNSRPLDAPIMGMNYSLEGGKEGMQPLQRRVSDSRLFKQKTRPNVLRAASSPTLEGGAFKVFLLLIAPKSKIFEIIQVFYSPLVTTVGNLLEMIPSNATEPALGAQQYIGMCRPKDGGREIDVAFMASASSSAGCAKIIRGEIMVAIPKGYSGAMCARFAKPLLNNPKVTKLLHKSDPLAPSKKKKKKRRSSSTRYKSIAVENDRSIQQSSVNPYEGGTKEERAHNKERKLLKKALQRGEQEAAFANVDDDYLDLKAGDTSDDDDESALRMPLEMWQTQMSFRSDSSASSVGSLTDLDAFTTPRNLHRSRRGSDLGPQILEEDAPALVDDNLTPSTKDSTNNNTVSNNNSDLDALQATLQTKDVSGAIEAFGKLLSSMGSQDEEVMKQLYAAMQKESSTKSNDA